MVLKPELEKQLNQTQLKMKELSIAIEAIDREFNQILSDIGVTAEQLNAFVDNNQNFSPPIWEKLQQEKKQLDEKLTMDLSQVKDPLKLKKAFSEQGIIQPHWLFVR